MKKLNILKSLIILVSVLFSTEVAFSQASTVQSLGTTVQSAVAVEKISALETGTINPATGTITGNLSSSFKLNTNEETTFFVVYSKIMTADGSEVSAFDGNGNILFANVQDRPLMAAVNNAKTGTLDNPNVIGYKIDLTGENLAIESKVSQTHGECYKVSLQNQVTTATLLQSITGNPALNTYSVGEDISGTYSVTVYVTATSQL